MGICFRREVERKDGSILLSPRLDEGQRQKIKCLKLGGGGILFHTLTAFSREGATKKHSQDFGQITEPLVCVR